MTDERHAARAAARRAHAEFQQCLALLAETIARAEHWYARRERQLVALDEHAADTVGRLRAGGHVLPTLVWHA